MCFKFLHPQFFLFLPPLVSHADQLQMRCYTWAGQMYIHHVAFKLQNYFLAVIPAPFWSFYRICVAPSFLPWGGRSMSLSIAIASVLGFCCFVVGCFPFFLYCLNCDFQCPPCRWCRCFVFCSSIPALNSVCSNSSLVNSFLFRLAFIFLARV